MTGGCFVYCDVRFHLPGWTLVYRPPLPQRLQLTSFELMIGLQISRDCHGPRALSVPSSDESFNQFTIPKTP